MSANLFKKKSKFLSAGIEERQRDRETERQRDRETERQRDRETERQRDRETERQREIIFKHKMFFYMIHLTIYNIKTIG
jgi:hypothetical protein